MYTDDDIVRMTRAARSRPKDWEDYRARLRYVGDSYALALRMRAPPPPSHIARKLQSQSRLLDDDIRPLLTVHARRAGYDGDVSEAPPHLLAEWARRARRRLDTRVAHRKAHGQPPHPGDKVINAFIHDMFSIYFDHFAENRYPKRGEQSPAVQFIQLAAHILSERMGDNQRLNNIKFDRNRHQIPTAKRLHPT